MGRPARQDHPRDEPGKEPGGSSSRSGAAARPVGLVDIHCHLLPGIDDGCRHVEESLECARRLVDWGFTHAICTPHIWEDLPHNNVGELPSAVQQLQARLDESQVPLRLLVGGENRLSALTVETPEDDLVLLAGGQSRGGRFFLFDTWEPAWPGYLQPTMQWLIDRGITPIMAHPERCAFINEDPLNAADRLSEMGVLLQLNCYIFSDRDLAPATHVGREMRKCAERLVEFDYYSFIGSDLHRGDKLTDRLAGLARCREVLGDEDFKRLTHRNPLQLLPAEV